MAKGKQKAADAAYRNAEAQRALVFVLGMAESYPKFVAVDEHEERELRECIATVRAHFLKVSEPPKVKTLAGQIDLVDGSVEGDGLEHESPPGLAHVPTCCPRCDANMMLAWGGNWTPMYKSDDEDFGKLQCGECAFVVTVTADVWDRVRDLRRRTIGAADRAPEKVDRGGRKTRGAG